METPSTTPQTILGQVGEHETPQADPAGEHTIAARPLPPTVTAEDWAVQAWINLKLLLDGLPLTPDSATLQTFLEQAPDLIARPAKAVLDHRYGTPNHGLPRAGSWVRVDDDEGCGIRGAVARVVQAGYGRVTIDVDVAGKFSLAAEHVTPVVYDRDHGWTPVQTTLTVAPQSEDLETDTDSDLVDALHGLFDRYGVLGVITAAARYGLRRATSTQCDEPHLGLATTHQLLDEIRARIEVHGPGLDYRTVDPS